LTRLQTWLRWSGRDQVTHGSGSGAPLRRM
jgi:hypothetical protein